MLRDFLEKIPHFDFEKPPRLKPDLKPFGRVSDRRKPNSSIEFIYIDAFANR